MALIEATAEASSAEILARSRLGIRIAAKIRTTGVTIPIYPRTRPAIASPEPFNLPALVRICEREICPKMIATMAAGKINEKHPNTRLAIALPLVSVVAGWPPATGTWLGCERDDVSAPPQRVQKFALSTF